MRVVESVLVPAEVNSKHRFQHTAILSLTNGTAKVQLWTSMTHHSSHTFGAGVLRGLLCFDHGVRFCDGHSSLSNIIRLSERFEKVRCSRLAVGIIC